MLIYMGFRAFDWKRWRDTVAILLRRDRRVPVPLWCVDCALDTYYLWALLFEGGVPVGTLADEALWVWYTSEWTGGGSRRFVAYGDFTHSVCVAWDCIIDGNTR